MNVYRFLCLAVFVVVGACSPRPAVMPLGSLQAREERRGTTEAADVARVRQLVDELRTNRGDAALEELVGIGEPAVVPLLKAAASSNPEVRRRAALALGLIGDPAATARLEALTDDGNSKVRDAAFSGLIVMLVAYTSTPDGWFRNGNAYQAARQALVKRGSRSVPYLLQGLEH